MSSATLHALLTDEPQVDPEKTKRQVRANPIRWRCKNAFEVFFVDVTHLTAIVEQIMEDNHYGLILSFMISCDPISQPSRNVRAGMTDPGSFTPGRCCVTFIDNSEE